MKANIQLTGDQVKRLEIVVLKLRGARNPIAEAVAIALGKQATIEEKRKVLAASYAKMFELMLAMNMAIDSGVSAADVEKRLKGRRDS